MIICLMYILGIVAEGLELSNCDLDVRIGEECTNGLPSRPHGALIYEIRNVSEVIGRI